MRSSPLGLPQNQCGFHQEDRSASLTRLSNVTNVAANPRLQSWRSSGYFLKRLILNSFTFPAAL
jgi:hypothetical protein